MPIQIGGVDLGKAIINLEYQLTRTQKLLEWLVNNNSVFVKPTKDDMVKIDVQALELVQKKYPEAGIKKEEE